MKTSALLLLVAACSPRTTTPPTMALESSAFRDRSPIPSMHTCEGADRSPPLRWSALPAGTQTLAVLVTDPDAPDPQAVETTWTHWVVWDLPATQEALPIGPGSLPEGAREGLNDWGTVGWRGPCPPKGRHRYEHRLYALDTALGELEHPDRAAVSAAMDGHVLGTATLTGTYEKVRGGQRRR